MLKRVLAMLALLLIGVPLHAQDEGTTTTLERVVAEITISSGISERANSIPIIESPSETLRSIVVALNRAGTDDEVKAVLVRFESPDWGLAQATEVERALRALRDSGKPVYVFTDAANIKDYYVASAATEIVMTPVGLLDLHGISFALYFMNDLLGKLGLSAEAVAEGRFKDAMDPLVRNEMSEGTRIQMTALANDVFGELRATVAANRNVTPEKAEELLTLGPYTSRKALEVGAVDRLAYFDELESHLDEMLGGDVLFDSDYVESDRPAVAPPNLMAILMRSFGASSKSKEAGPKIALVYAVGAIVDGRSNSSNPFAKHELVAGDDFIDILDDVADDPDVKAVVLRVNSPGGSAIASDRIWNRLQGLRESGVPVVVSMGDVAASGGYYISMGADRIYAEPMTITGSIGVIGGKVSFGGTYDKIGVHRQSINIGPHSDLYNESRAWTPEEHALIQGLLDGIYSDFLEKAAEGRGRTKDEIHDLAEGRVWSGAAAKTEGLVDEMGGLEEAIAAARELAAEPDAPVVEFPKQLGFLETIEKLLSGGVAASTPNGISSRIPPAWQAAALAVPEPLLAQTWLFLEATRGKFAVLAMAPYWVEVE